MAESGTPRRRIPLPRPMLRARINDVRVLASLIRPIAMAAHATVLVEEGGLIFLTEYDRCVQARAYVVKQLFASYETNLDRALNPDADFTLDTLEGPGPVEFEINLKTFLESIDIFGGAPTIKANGPGSSSSGPGGFGNFGQGRTMYRPYDPAATKVEGQGKWKRRFGTGFGTAEGDRDDEDSDRHVSRPTSMVMSYEGKGSPLILV
ncbi:checkpoint clamp complex protein Rad1 [Tilletia horrida]|nr:checkpoint clamp complex protein Rad1 [Tilletia horrida]